MDARSRREMRSSDVSARAPLISVVVPLHNGEETLPQTIDSVCRQTLADFELIVIDDGSTDRALEFLESVRDPRLRVFRYANSGLGVARNRGIERSRGEFISFIDSDDLWTPDKLALQLQALRQQPEAALAYSWTAFVDQHGDFLFAKDASFCEGDVYVELLRHCFVASGSNILVRKSCALTVGGFDTALPAAQDWEFCLRVAARWRFAVVPRYQVLYRISEGAMSANAERCEEAMLRICDRAFEARPRQLPKRGEKSRRREAVRRISLSHPRIGARSMEEGGTEARGVHPPSSANPADTEDLASAVRVVAAAASTSKEATSRRAHPPQDLRSMVDVLAPRCRAARRGPR